jgi:hypothetical protein
MADLHVQRLRAELERRFGSLVDMTDYRGKSDADRTAKLLSRSMAAFALVALEGASDADAAAAVVDEFNDNGIDAVYFNAAESKLVICQSKWMANGHGSPSQADVKKFLAGVGYLANLDLARFGDRMVRHKSMLDAAMTNTDVSIKLVLTYSGQDQLGGVVEQDLTDFLAQNNNPTELFSLEVMGLKRNYDAIVEQQGGAPITIEIGLREWGTLAEPYKAFYGHTSARDIAAWWQSHGRRLLAKNIRSFKGSTDVNEGMASTLRLAPRDFWYFNNGITLLCASIKKTPVGASRRDFGQFVCSGVSIVNGAQTVGQIGTSFPKLEDIPEDAQVLVRLISLEEVPKGFDERITRATNTQNRVEGRDFASLDGNQRRIHRELALDGIDYSFRSGDPQPDQKSGCTIVEAAIALACVQPDVAVAVLVKNQIGRLFENLHAAPYTDLFNDRTSAREVWRAVRLMRAVDAAVVAKSQASHRAKILAAHGNRFILHMVFKDPSLVSWRDEKNQIEQLEVTAQKAANSAFMKLAAYLQQHEPNAYLQPLFKTQDRCRALIAGLGLVSTPQSQPSAPAPAQAPALAPAPAKATPHDRCPGLLPFTDPES